VDPLGPVPAPAAGVELDTISTSQGTSSGCSTMAVRQPSKLLIRVRFPSPAPTVVALAFRLWLRPGVGLS
jgi:hypothetical protein